MRYFKKMSLILFLAFIFVVLFFFLKGQVTDYIEFERLENAKRINLLEEKIINRDNDLLFKVNMVLNDIKHKQDYMTQLTNSSMDELLIREVDRLLFIANSQLSIGNNVEGATATLESIILFINKVSPNNSLFNNVIEDIKIDLSSLRRLYISDFAENMNKIKRLSDLIKIGFSNKNLPSVQCKYDRDDFEHSYDQGLDDSWSYWARKNIDNFSKALKSFTIRLFNSVELQKVGNLTDISLANINLILVQQISIAQFSLIMNQPFLLRSSMDCIMDIINLSFDVDSANALEALSLARDINSLKIENTIPDISRSLNSIKKLCCFNVINN